MNESVSTSETGWGKPYMINEDNIKGDSRILSNNGTSGCSGGSPTADEDPFRRNNDVPKTSTRPAIASDKLPKDCPLIEIKLFIGKIPNAYHEEDVTRLFEPFGPYSGCMILTDKHTQRSKGSAFLWMKSIANADHAIRTLHGRQILAPMSIPMVVDYAVGEGERLGLFPTDPGQDKAILKVRWIPSDVTEAELLALFARYGACTIADFVRSSNGDSECCITYEYKENALWVVKSTDNLLKARPTSRALSVRFKEDPEIKDNNRINDTRASHAWTQPQQVVQQQPAWDVPKYGTADYLHDPFTRLNNNPTATTPQTTTTTTVAQQQTFLPPGWQEYFDTNEKRPYYYNPTTGTTQWERPVDIGGEQIQQAHNINRHYNRQSASRERESLRTGGEMMDRNHSHYRSPSLGGSHKGEKQGQSHASGPLGANLFIFHVPNDWTIADLDAAFSKFGNIISSHIVQDPVTKRNKGYGFLSFDKLESAAHAIVNMNGFQVGSKRLTAYVKKGEEEFLQDTLAKVRTEYPTDMANAGGMHGSGGQNMALGGRTTGVLSNNIPSAGWDLSSSVPGFYGAPPNMAGGGGGQQLGGVEGTQQSQQHRGPY